MWPLPFGRCSVVVSGSMPGDAGKNSGGNTLLALVTEMEEGMIIGKSSDIIGSKAAIPNIYVWGVTPRCSPWMTRICSGKRDSCWTEWDEG